MSSRSDINEQYFYIDNSSYIDSHLPWRPLSTFGIPITQLLLLMHTYRAPMTSFPLGITVALCHAIS